jgi:hypothetical protein
MPKWSKHTHESSETSQGYIYIYISYLSFFGVYTCNFHVSFKFPFRSTINLAVLWLVSTHDQFGCDRGALGTNKWNRNSEKDVSCL